MADLIKMKLFLHVCRYSFLKNKLFLPNMQKIIWSNFCQNIIWSNTIFQDEFRNLGIFGVLFSKITPVRKPGYLGSTVSKMPPVCKLFSFCGLDQGVKVDIYPSLELLAIDTILLLWFGSMS